MACVKATVTLSKVVLSTRRERYPMFRWDCCGGVSFCEGEGVIGGVCYRWYRDRSRGVIDGDTTVMVEVVVLEATESGAVVRKMTVKTRSRWRQ